jgi:hypothetical protein
MMSRMDVSSRTWRIRMPDGTEVGPLGEEEFQDRLRRGEFPLGSQLRSDRMEAWKPLLEVVSTDESFARPSTIPPPVPADG